MSSADYWKDLLLKVESEASIKPQQKEVSFAIYQEIKNIFNCCLKNKDYTQLQSLLDYFEHSEKYPFLVHSGDTRRVYVTILFTSYELEAKSENYLSSVSTYQEFLQQYIQTVFALRRLELLLSTELVSEAIEYVQSIPLSAYAARGIIENEYFENKKTIYWNLYQAKKNQWNIAEKTVFLYRLIEHGDNYRAYLELSSLCIENNEYKHAYNLLCKIPDPSSDVIELITSLKGLLPNE